MSMASTDSGDNFSSLSSGGRRNLVHSNISGEYMADNERTSVNGIVIIMIVVSEEDKFSEMLETGRGSVGEFLENEE